MQILDNWKCHSWLSGRVYVIHDHWYRMKSASRVTRRLKRLFESVASQRLLISTKWSTVPFIKKFTEVYFKVFIFLFVADKNTNLQCTDITGMRVYSRHDSKTGSNWRLRELTFVFCCFGSTSSRSSRFIREKNLLPSEFARITVTTWSELHCLRGRAYTAFERDNFLCERTILRVRGASSAKVKWLKSRLPRS